MRGSISGTSGPLKREHPNRYFLFGILDSFISTLIVGPAVIGYWRSVWMLLGLYIFPENPLISCVISTVLGNVGHVILIFSQSFLKQHLHPSRNKFLFYVCSRLYTAVFAFICVNWWRGPWNLLDLYTGTEVTSVVFITAISVVALAAMRTLRNVSAAPCAIMVDTAEGYFEVVTMFRVVGERTSLYILDCLFSVLVVGTLVVFVWRGLWVLLDLFLFPEDETLSAWSSLVIGYSIVAIAFLMQPAMRWLCDRLSAAPRLLVADLFLLFSLVSTINVWRGLWNLLNIYLLPGNPELSCWITHWVCLILLIVLGCSNSLLVRGVYIDAEEPSGKCVIFPCYYLRVLLQRDENQKAEQQNSKQKAVALEKISVITTDMSINHICKKEAPGT